MQKPVITPVSGHRKQNSPNSVSQKYEYTVNFLNDQIKNNQVWNEYKVVKYKTINNLVTITTFLTSPKLDIGGGGGGELKIFKLKDPSSETLILRSR